MPGMDPYSDDDDSVADGVDYIGGSDDERYPPRRPDDPPIRRVDDSDLSDYEEHGPPPQAHASMYDTESDSDAEPYRPRFASPERESDSDAEPYRPRYASPERERDDQLISPPLDSDYSPSPSPPPHRRAPGSRSSSPVEQEGPWWQQSRRRRPRSPAMYDDYGQGIHHDNLSDSDSVLGQGCPPQRWDSSEDDSDSSGYH